MESAIAKAINLKSYPVAILWTDEKPEGAAQFSPGSWGCVMAMLGAAATKAKSAVFDRDSFGCVGGGYGLGFGNTYEQFPGGLEGFSRFLSSGNAGWEPGERIAEGMRAGGARGEFVDHFLHGERYKKDPETVRRYLEALPPMEIPTRYVAFRPLTQVAEGVEPVAVSVLVDPDQLAALVVLANYDRPGLENVAIPFVAGCQAVALLAFREASSEHPRCIVGQTDLSARKYLRSQAGKEITTFTMPFRRFREMESNVPGSFLEGDTWHSLQQ
ncbi:DUF169 domain-containing protein [Geobacter sp. DSM 9736]|uniref:DUF169 domain-containing protein n=1 Tax=Geobacter sp. DSM 9736 TaxID=1277350 RepID=UPI000B5097E1|nr:DUF169 domain-containing protein [Geobacter sp. DSM 9736]SNB47366.1 Uncharacterised ArCR, COG2043 [Geobacter sp. DSM 9736]